MKYKDENSLACVVTLAYLSARNKYKVEREKKVRKDLRILSFIPEEKICRESS